MYNPALYILGSLFAVTLVAADLPSCYRARCTHCNVVFIAQMCPNTCASCYGGDPERFPSGPRIRAGTAHHKPTLVNNGASISNNPHRIHGQPTANGNNVGAQIQGSQASEGLSQSQQGRIPQAHSLPDAPAQAQGQYQAPLQQISSNTGDSTGAAQQPQVQQIQTPQHIQTPQLPQYTQQVPSQQPFQQQGTQPTSYGSSYAQSSNLNTATYNQQPAFNQFQQQQPQQQLNYFGQPQAQPQQQAGFFGQPQAQTQPGQFGVAQQQPAFGQQSGFGAQSLPQTPGAQSSGTPFANPFQPFLQQTYQAQQAQPQLFQPFTLAPLATPAPLPAPAAVTPAPFQFQPQQQLSAQPQGQQALYPLQQPQPQQYNVQGFAQPQGQVAQGAFTLSPPPAQPALLQPQATGPQGPQNTQYSFAPNQQPQNDLSSIDAQRPRQLYNNGQSLQPPTPPKQEPAPATNIDPTPVNVNKYASSYTDNKGIGNYGSITKPTDGSEKYSGQCPKQPNWEPCISKDIANERFRNCCNRLGEGCAALCSYDQTLTTIQLAVLTGRCPIGKVGDMMVCASGYEDASSCCQAHNVFEPGYEHCRPYCNPSAGLPGANDGMSSLADKYRCLGKLSQIQRCFYVTQRP